ncbi:MAG: hypothetical protein LBC75_03690 [Fibromonadaceae bacterium]|nr:hypothetical protein [Fibromonadaceae bacterium]
MIKKIKFVHFIPLALAVFVTIVIVIACGRGIPEDVEDPNIRKQYDKAYEKLQDDKDRLSMIAETPSSSSKPGKSSSSDENDDSSSSTKASGSSSSINAQSSSSGAVQSSSSSTESPYILSCVVKVGYDTGTVRKAVPKKNMPEVKCTDKKDPTKVTTLDQETEIFWSNAPRWTNPTEIKNYDDIRARVDSDDNKKPCQGETVKCEGTFRICAEGGCPVPVSSSSTAPSSSSSAATVVSSSSTASAVSSSSRASSSSTASTVSSSSTTAGNSSGSTTYTLACAAVPASGTAGTAITAPAVTCNGTAVSSGLNWTNAPNWSNPVVGEYRSISVSASSGNCSGKTATCSGTLVVSAAPVTYTLACAAVPASGTAGTPITPPAVTCNGTAVSSGLNWSGTPTAPAWNNPVANTYTSISVSASSGNCSGKTATCSGTLTVSAPAVTYTLACTGLAATGKVGESITPPTVKCNGSDNTSTTLNAGLDWPGAPSWTNPTAAEYNVSVTASTGNCSGKTASCGKITVAAANTCAYKPAWCSNIAFKGSKMFAASGALVSNDSKVTGGTAEVNEPFKNEWGNDLCIFVTGANRIQGDVGSTTFTLVNGQAPAALTNGFMSFTTFLNGIQPADGGYYILRKANTWWQIENATGGTLPSCTP